MAECPFCQAEVEENLVILGGRCPICFGGIPGEEAPTDPGDEVRAEQEKADRHGLWIRRMILMGSVASVLCAGAAATLSIVFWPEPELPPIDFDSAEFYQPMELVAWVEPETAAPNPGLASTVASPRPVGSSLKGFTGTDVGTAEVDVSSLGRADDVRGAERRGTRSGTADEDIGDLGPTGGGPSSFSGGVDLGGVSIGVERRFQKGVRLTDDEAIIAHLRDVMSAEIPKLNHQCYTKFLKADPSLQGKWRLDFTVGSEGNVKSVQVTARNTPHADFQRCISDRIMAWHFNPLKADQGVGKSVTFRPR